MSDNPNDVWSHAVSIEEKRMKYDRRVELEYMKDLFLNKLPIGDNVEHLQRYFNDLEKVIYTTDNVKNDEFPSNDTERDYRYFSASLLKERASRDPDITNGENVADSTHPIGSGRAIQADPSKSEPVSCIPEHSEYSDVDIYDKLDATSEACDS